MRYSVKTLVPLVCALFILNLGTRAAARDVFQDEFKNAESSMTMLDLIGIKLGTCETANYPKTYSLIFVTGEVSGSTISPMGITKTITRTPDGKIEMNLNKLRSMVIWLSPDEGFRESMSDYGSISEMKRMIRHASRVLGQNRVFLTRSDDTRILTDYRSGYESIELEYRRDRDGYVLAKHFNQTKNFTTYCKISPEPWYASYR